MSIFAGLDVSDKSTHICVVDAEGGVLRRDVVASDPEALASWLNRHCPDLVRVVLETGPLSTFLYRGQDIERAQIYAKRLCAHLWVDSMRRRLQHSKGIHRTVVASPLVAEPAYRQRRDSVVRHLRKYCLGNTFQHEAVSIRDMAKDFG